MKWKAYPEYRPSGVEWLGRIPAQWEVKRLKQLCTRSALYGANEPADSYASEGARFLRTTDITDQGKLVGDGVYLPRDVVRDYLLEDGDILFSRSGTIGRSFLYREGRHGPCAYAGYLVRFVPGPMLDSSFAFYFSKSNSFERWLGGAVISSTIGNVNGQKFANLQIPCPSYTEQRAIAAFLDRETARIDALIEKKERQIELLQEKRAALITHAVTKGLDPSVKMKPSGIEWLGEIPKHWVARRVKFVAAKIGSGKTPKGGAEVYVDSGVLLLRSQNIHFDGIRLDDAVFIDSNTDSEMENTRVQPGDVLLNITGASLGRCALVSANVPAANVNQHVCIVRPRRPAIEPYYLWAVFASRLAQTQILANEAGSSREGLNFQQVGNLVTPLPPNLREQQQISRYIETRIGLIDKVVGQIRQSIAIAREYRTALVSAAVTGKIDVREEASA